MKSFLTILSLAALVTAQVFAQSDLQAAAVVRLTRTEPISVKLLRAEVERMEKSAGRALTTDEKWQVLDVMINERLAIQAAERDRVTISDNEVNQQIQQLRVQMAQGLGRQPTDDEFTRAIQEQTGLEMAVFREQLRRLGLVQKYLMSKKQNLFNSVKTPTEAEILSAYNLAKAQFVRPETVRFSMIQIPPGSDAPGRTRARELADRLVREIGSNPAKFDEAVTRSLAPNSGYQGGDGGYLPRNIQAQQIGGEQFNNTAFNLRQGEVSRLMENPRGYQIIKITETYEMKNLDLDDIFQLGTRITVRDYIGNAMLQERQQAVIEQATQELITELRRGNPFEIYRNNITW
jgi:parvulin-like peptidyl-prolyl isomerase